MDVTNGSLLFLEDMDNSSSLSYPLSMPTKISALYSYALSEWGGAICGVPGVPTVSERFVCRLV
jgi:hypothetical protein